MSSLLTPYVASVWSAERKTVASTQELNCEASLQSVVSPESQLGSPIIKDLLVLAKRVNQLEDEVAQISAERDRTKAQLDILRQHNEIGREEMMKKQVFCN